MKSIFWLALAFLALAAIAAMLLKGSAKGGAVSTKRKALMTKREQAMYWRLRQTFPECVVLAQVAFSALITSEFKHRNRYDRKTADFVICDPALQVLAVIELDDASHKGREASDAARAHLLTSAGYTLLRFENVPDAAELRARLPLLSPTPADAGPKSSIAAPLVSK